jgi:hypothetical protein
MSCEDQGPTAATACDPCSPAVRNRYFRGKLMTVADYQAEQRYMIQRRRAINRAMFGWGVAYGFALRHSDRTLEIGPGLALDPHGRELVACEQVRLDDGDDLIWLRDGDCGLEPFDPPEKDEKEQEGDGDGHCEAEGGAVAAAVEAVRPHEDEGAVKYMEGGGEPARIHALAPERIEALKKALQDKGAPDFAAWLLSAHYAERRIGGVRVSESCDTDICETNHVCETVVYSLRLVGRCPSGLPACPTPPFPTADCALAGPASGDELAPFPGVPAGVSPREDRGPQRTLCEWSLNDYRRPDPCTVGRLVRHRGLEFDPDAGVPLGCVAIARDDCGRLYVSALAQDCDCRRLMRPNELLFDLIRGCDLTVIRDIGWANWHRREHDAIARRDFREMFVRPAPAGDRPPDEYGDDDETGAPPKARPRGVHTRFWVCLSGPVKTASLTPDVFSMTLVRRDSDEDLGAAARVPIVGIRVDPPSPGDPKGTTRRFSPVVSHRFWHGEIHEAAASGFDRINQVEIRIDGDRIVDARGQPLDANARGLALPSGNGSPGGEFRSIFVVRRGGDRVPPHSSAGAAPDAKPADAGGM